MSAYKKLFISNLIMFVVFLSIYSFLFCVPSNLAVGAVIGGGFLVAIAIYLFIYGIISCKITRSIIFPNLMLFGFVLIISFSMAIMNFNSAGRNFDGMAVEDTFMMIFIFMLFSLIPSIITKIVMILLDKRKKAKSTDEKG